VKIAIIADIHGNLPALEAVLSNKEFLSADSRYCLGDLVGYYPFPDECVKRVAREKIPCVMGNHDYSAVCGVPCRQNEVGFKSLEMTKNFVSETALKFLSKLPHTLIVSADKRKLFLVHGSLDNHLDGYVYSEDKVAVPKGFDALCMGHTHKPFTRKEGEKLIVNPGSVGQPRDGDKRASFAVIDTEKMTAKIVRVKYDASVVIARTLELGFEEAAEALEK
jgi:putative phosphoesterase